MNYLNWDNLVRLWMSAELSFHKTFVYYRNNRTIYLQVNYNWLTPNSHFLQFSQAIGKNPVINKENKMSHFTFSRWFDNIYQVNPKIRKWKAKLRIAGTD